MELWPFLLLLAIACVNGRLDLDINEKHHTTLGACQACKAVVKSFKAVSISSWNYDKYRFENC